MMDFTDVVKTFPGGERFAMHGRTLSAVRGYPLSQPTTSGSITKTDRRAESSAGFQSLPTGGRTTDFL